MRISHIRRTDEVNITECDVLTDYDTVITDTPVAVGDFGDVAVFPDVSAPIGFTMCPKCWAAYSAELPPQCGLCSSPHHATDDHGPF